MKIYKDILKEIIVSTKDSLYEIGGMLGGSKGVVKVCEIDEGEVKGGCIYKPNVKHLNKKIMEWQRTQIEFMGLFHLHFFGVRTLSEEDVFYIKKIFNSMPKGIKVLYFPVVVLPECEVVSYIAKRESDKIIVEEDEMVIC